MRRDVEKRFEPAGSQSYERRMASLRVAEAASNVRSALAGLSSALRHETELRARDAVGTVKRELSDGGQRMQNLLTRVPAVGPWLVLEWQRVRPEAQDAGEAPFSESSRYNEVPELYVQQPVSDYLDCIGVHVA